MIMNENMCQAYDFIMESKNEPSYLKVMKWAISYEHNSPKPNEDGSIQDSHIGNYFSNILFKAASFAEKDCQMCLIYTGKLKSNMAYGSTKVTDLRTITIEYHVNGLEEIKYMCKSEPALLNALDRNCPPSGDAGASLLHDIAQECIRSVVMYPENDTNDRYVFHHLSTLGLQLKASPLLPKKILRTGEKNSNGKGGRIPQGSVTVFEFTVPAENLKKFNREYGIAHEQGIKVQNTVNASNEDYKFRRISNHDQWTQERTVNDDGSNTYKIATVSDFADLFVKRITELGIIDHANTKTIALTKTGKIVLSSNVKSASAKNDNEPTTAATIAFEASDFERGAKLAGALVKRYMASHPKGKAELEVDDNAQSVTITGMSKGSIEDSLEFLKSKGLTFSKM